MLTQFVLTNAKPKVKPYTLSDGQGLHLFVQPNGSKLWRFRYRFNGKANMLSLGAFPTVTLLEARGKRDDAKRLLAQNINPSEKRKTEKTAAVVASGNTFGAIATEHLAKIEAEGAAESTMDKNRWLLNDLAAPLHSRPVTAITPREVLDLLRKIEQTGRRETAHRLKGTIGTVFRFAIVTDRCETDPTASLILRQWETPEHDWGEKTGWRLFNAATFALTGRVSENPRATADLHKIIDGVCEHVS
jgi:hypothetical protein